MTASGQKVALTCTGIEIDDGMGGHDHHAGPVAATRVRSSGVSVLLADSRAVCVPNGTGVIISVVQVRVKAIL